MQPCAINGAPEGRPVAWASRALKRQSRLPCHQHLFVAAPPRQQGQGWAACSAFAQGDSSNSHPGHDSSHHDPVQQAESAVVYQQSIDNGLVKTKSQGLWGFAQQILRLSLPLTLTNVSGFTLNCLSDAMVGRLGAAALSTSTLANSFYGMMGVSVIWGGAAGMETLAGQAYGAGNLRVMRMVLLRAMVVCWGLCLPIVLLWQHAEWIMIKLGQNPAIAEHGAAYLQALGPSLFVYVLAECLQSYLVASNNVQPTTWAKGITAALGPVLYYLLMFKCNLGLAGAAYAYALCKLANALLLMGWIAWQGQGPSIQANTAAGGTKDATSGFLKSSSPETQSDTAASSNRQRGDSPHTGGDALLLTTLHSSSNSTTTTTISGTRGEQSSQAATVSASVTSNLFEGITLQDVVDPRGCWEYIKFGLPSAAMTMLEWWAYEAQIIMAGTLPNAEIAVAVLGICFAISGWVYMFPQSVATATCTRVSNALGSGDAEAARSYFRTALVMVFLQQSVLASLILSFSPNLVSFFCTDPAVMSIAQGIVPMVALNTMSDGVNVVLNGILRACGRQALGARLQLCSYWLVGVPLAYFLGVRAQLGTAGFLAAVGVTSFLQACVCGTIISRFQWSEEVARASKMLEQMSATMESSSAEDGAPSEQDDGSSGPLLSSMAMPAPIRQPS